jgi:hypothetical protein
LENAALQQIVYCFDSEAIPAIRAHDKPDTTIMEASETLKSFLEIRMTPSSFMPN